MAITLNMGVEGVSYQPPTVESRTDYPRNKVNLPSGASIPSHLDKVFHLYANQRMLLDAMKPSLSNPYVTTPALYAKLFSDIEAASRRHPGGTGETGRILRSAHRLLLAMKEDLQAFVAARNTLIEA